MPLRSVWLPAVLAPRPRAAVVALFLMAAIAYGDAHTSSEISLWPLYIAPVSLTAWRYGFLEGGVCAALCGALLMISAMFSGHPYSTPMFFLAATLGQLAALLIIAWYAARNRLTRQ